MMSHTSRRARSTLSRSTRRRYQKHSTRIRVRRDDISTQISTVGGTLVTLWEKLAVRAAIRLVAGQEPENLHHEPATR